MRIFVVVVIVVSAKVCELEEQLEQLISLEDKGRDENQRNVEELQAEIAQLRGEFFGLYASLRMPRMTFCRIVLLHDCPRDCSRCDCLHNCLLLGSTCLLPHSKTFVYRLPHLATCSYCKLLPSKRHVMLRRYLQ